MSMAIRENLTAKEWHEWLPICQFADERYKIRTGEAVGNDSCEQLVRAAIEKLHKSV